MIMMIMSVYNLLTAKFEYNISSLECILSFLRNIGTSKLFTIECLLFEKIT